MNTYGIEIKSFNKMVWNSYLSGIPLKKRIIFWITSETEKHSNRCVHTNDYFLNNLCKIIVRKHKIIVNCNSLKTCEKSFRYRHWKRFTQHFLHSLSNQRIYLLGFGRNVWLEYKSDWKYIQYIQYIQYF